MKILIVDDDELNRKILQTIVVDAGFEAVMAVDGADAIEKLTHDAAIQIILLDRMMPRLNGIEFMKAFQQHPEWAYKKVIMQTAANQPKDVIEGKSTGIYYYLTKPFDDEIVLSIIRAAADEINRLHGR